MKVAIYSPYLDTFGGGEKYMMTIAEVLSLENAVDVLLDKHLESFVKEYLKSNLSNRFDLNLKKVNFISAPVGKNSSVISRTFFLKNYDLLFYLTDGSIFYPTAKKNILHVQSPLLGQPAKSMWGKFKLKGWDLIIYNSRFTQTFAQSWWRIKSEVIYPPIDTNKIKPLKKKKYILSVGRFFGYLKDKKHLILINTFKELLAEGLEKEWSLHLVGSANQGDRQYLNELKKKAKGLPIKFYPNLDYNELVKLYGESSIYWHAAGFEEVNPTKMEHFGISTVEAMAAGCVPIVIAKGGQIEIVDHLKSGYLWQNLKELKQYTMEVTKDEKLRNKMAQQAIEKAEVFDRKTFEEKIAQITKL